MKVVLGMTGHWSRRNPNTDTVTEHTDVGRAAATKYYYRIRALTAGEEEGAWSS